MSGDHACPAALKDVKASGPECWGPPQWIALHQYARSYPRKNPTNEVQQAARNYVMAMVHLIPCNECSGHWAKIAPTVVTTDRCSFLKWTIDVHNQVNARKGKPVLSYEEAVRQIEATCPNNTFLPCKAYVPRTLHTVNSLRDCMNVTTASRNISIGVGVTAAALLALCVVFIVLYVKAKRR